MTQDDKELTESTFREKWRRWPDLLADPERAVESGVLGWILTRNGWDSAEDLASFLSERPAILDAGCGNGRITQLLRGVAPQDSQVWGWDVNEDAARERFSGSSGVIIENVDLSENLPDGISFDFIYCQEVLHHLPAPEDAFLALSRLLKKGGVIAIYVYGEKHPIREFSDEWVRNRLNLQSFQSQCDISEGLASLGKQLSEIRTPLSIQGLDKIGFPEGHYPVQKFVYDFLLKCFWNDAMGLDESAAINFDWFGPQTASKHSLAEVRQWCKAANLHVTHAIQDEYGITVHGTKP